MRDTRWIVVIFLVATYLALGSPARALNNALDFDGSDDGVDCTDPVDNDFDLTGNATLEAWVRIDTTPPALTSGTAFTVVGKDEGAGNDVRKWFFGVQNGGLAFHINGPGYGGGRWLYSSSITQPFGSCYHVAVVKNANSYAFYIDGVPRGGGTTDAVYDVNTALAIGYAEPCCKFAGRIDEVRIWNVARSQTEINDSKGVALTGTETGLVGYYKMDQTGDTNAIDSTPNGRHGVRFGSSGANNKPQYVASCSPVALAPSVPATNAWGIAAIVLCLALVAIAIQARRETGGRRL